MKNLLRLETSNASIKNHDFTRKVIQYYRVTNLYAGPQFTLSLLDKVWFVDGRSIVSRQLGICLQCIKPTFKASQLMIDLPAIQICPSDSVGLDFIGPFFTKCASV